MINRIKVNCYNIDDFLTFFIIINMSALVCHPLLQCEESDSTDISTLYPLSPLPRVKREAVVFIIILWDGRSMFFFPWLWSYIKGSCIVKTLTSWDFAWELAHYVEADGDAELKVAYCSTKMRGEINKDAAHAKLVTAITKENILAH